MISYVSRFLIIQCLLGNFILEKSSHYRVSKAEEEFKMAFIGQGLTAYADVLDKMAPLMRKFSCEQSDAEVRPL